MPKNELTIIKYYYYDSIQEINNILSCCEYILRYKNITYLYGFKYLNILT